jgi:(R)-citramalyl-CoA lyase
MIVCDVGPRDGLQNDPTLLEPAVRADLCNRLAAAGVPLIEAVSFVDDRRVPAMAGAERVVALLAGTPAAERLAGLVLNQRGYDRAIAAGLRTIHYAFPVTDAFARRNQNMTVEQGIALGIALAERARADGVRLSIALSAAFGCPFDGAVAARTVVDVAERVAAGKPDELSLADTIGVAVPRQVRELIAALAGLGPAIGAHFHNTRNTGYANALAAVEAGAAFLDASIGGVGGCPFAPRATGNIATEDLVYLLDGMGVETGIDLDALIDCARWLAERLGHDIAGQLAKAGNFALTA